MLLVSSDRPTPAIYVDKVVPLDGGAFGWQKKNGKFVSLNELGDWGERDAVQGNDEMFYRGDNGGWAAPGRGLQANHDFIIAAVASK